MLVERQRQQTTIDKPDNLAGVWISAEGPPVPPIYLVSGSPDSSLLARPPCVGRVGVRWTDSLRVDALAPDAGRTSALGWPLVANGYAARRV